MRITAKGQVTIPQDVRERAGLMPGTGLMFEIDAGGVRLAKAAAGAGRRTRGQKPLESLRGKVGPQTSDPGRAPLHRR